MPAVRVLMLCLCGVLLAGCSGDNTPSAKQTTSVATTAPSTVTANGTTVPGTVLSVGRRAVVRWRADKTHNSRLSLTVTAVRRGSIKDLKKTFKLSAAARSSTLYYVTAALRNTGTGDLSGQTLTLYGKVSKDLVVRPVTIVPAYDRCDNRSLPAPFREGAKARECIVMLAPAHGMISAVQWRGSGRSRPISWRVP